MNLGNKIVVLGVSASGKSTFARALAEKVTLPLVHMDAIMWKPGWNYIGDQNTVEQLREISSTADWLIEGYISSNARAFVLERADTILYLDYPSHVSAWRYIKRWLMHRKTPRPELVGSPDKFSFNFLHRVWAKLEVKNLIPHLEKPENTSKTIVFKHPKQAASFLKKV